MWMVGIGNRVLGVRLRMPPVNGVSCQGQGGWSDYVLRLDVCLDHVWGHSHDTHYARFFSKCGRSDQL